MSIAKNSHCLAELVMEAQVLDKERVWSRVVIDCGQGSIKVCASIFDRDTDPDVLFGGQEGPGEKMTGVNRLLFLAEVDG